MTPHVGVKTAAGAFLPGILEVGASAGLTYGVVVPFDVAVGVFVSGGSAQLNASSGSAVAGGGEFSQITVPSTGTPPSLTYTLAGVHTP
jgi:hypothetical protein